jgi:hypothetical protein
MESYIQYAAGYNKDNVDEEDINKAIEDIQQMDDEHGAFWVSIITDNENVIEVDKSLRISIILEPDNDKEIKYIANDWNEVKYLYLLLLGKKFEDIKRLINKN